MPHPEPAPLSVPAQAQTVRGARKETGIVKGRLNCKGALISGCEESMKTGHAAMLRGGASSSPSGKLLLKQTDISLSHPPEASSSHGGGSFWVKEEPR